MLALGAEDMFDLNQLTNPPEWVSSTKRS